MGLSQNIGARQAQTQTVRLSPQAQQGLRMLGMSLPELRTELLKEMSENPVIDDVEPTLEKTPVSDKVRESASDDRPSDYPEDDVPDVTYTEDADRLERRQKFFDSQVVEETLADHLLAQLGVSDIEPEDRPLAEMLIGDLDANGYFCGSLPDIMMVTGESEEKVRAVLREIQVLDPVGCGATSAAECLEAQIGDIADPAVRQIAQRIIRNHLPELGAGRKADIAAALGISSADVEAACRAILTLKPYPGRAYGMSVRPDEYINPEVHAVRRADGGWEACVDARSLPEIRISPRYEAMLADPKATAETKAYVRERIAHAQAVVEAIRHRQETITSIAQMIFDAQPDFFEQGLKGLRPLTMQQVADRVDVAVSTVSRTVNGKYASTPRGTVELRRFFTQGITTANGEVIANDRVKARLKELVEAEDRSHPLSDDQLTELLNKEGFPIKRRTTAKYREALGLPTAAKRKNGVSP